MARRILVGVIVLAIAARASAQFVVIDVAHLVQALLVAERVQRHLDELRAQAQTIQRMAQGLPGMDRYRLPTIPVTLHDADRWVYGRPWIEALTRGDLDGAAYRAGVVPLASAADLLAALPLLARQQVERQIATVEIADAVASLAGHQVGATRAAYGRTQAAVDALERDVVATGAGYHDLTAVLDKVAAGELLARRQDLAANQLLTSAVEQLLARSKRQRDTEALALNMQAATWRDGPTAYAAFAAGAGEALRTWRQP